MSYCIVLCTVPNMEEAKKIAHGLVNNKLAACINIITGVTSVYFWQGEVCEDSELILFIKTQKPLFEEVKEFILKNHSYTLPEIVSLSVETAHQPYLGWIRENTKGSLIGE